MKSNLIIIFVLVFFNSIFTNVYSEEEFNFDVTELKILEDGNLFVGLKDLLKLCGGVWGFEET